MTLRLEDLPPGTQTDLMTTHGVAPTKKKSKNSLAADQLWFELRAHRMQDWIREHAFAREDFVTPKGNPRQWRFDFAHMGHKLAIEVEGLVVKRIGGQMVCMGRHTTIEGFTEDCRKYAAAIELGWHVLRFNQAMIRSGEAIATVERVLARRGWSRSSGS